MAMDGSGSFIIKEKLKRLKCELKIWNNESFGSIEDNIQKIVEEIKLLDDKVEKDAHLDGDILKRRRHFETFWKFSRMQEAQFIRSPD